VSRDVLDEAYRHFELSGGRFEYGRPDLTQRGAQGNPTDPSRTEADRDRDGMGGVDCSSFVWRGLRNAGYGVPDEPFATSALFSGSEVTEYARDNFDVIAAEDAQATNGTLEPGDILMFDSNHGRHVGIFSGYDEQGHIQFYGSQVSTGPAMVAGGTGGSTAPGGYWNGGDFTIVGALRPKEEFRVAEPLNAALGPVEIDVVGSRQDGPAGSPDPLADGALSKGEKGDAVGGMQIQLRTLGYTDQNGVAIEPDKNFGGATEHAVRQFQTDRGLPVTGIADEATRNALDAATALPEREIDRLDPVNLRRPSQAPEATDPLFASMREHVYAMDRSMGRTPDAASDRVAASLTAEWRANGLTESPDSVVLGQKGTKAEAGEYVFAYSGSPERPNDFVGVRAADAVQTPVEQSMAKAQEAVQRQALEAQQVALAQQQSADGPRMTMG
jgi:peptidoglycan hydrolase-like protein with peptidoglycan-binding domain